MSNSNPWVLGISGSHNGAACLLHGDRIVTAIQEERLTRTKRQRLFGASESLAVNYCLDYAGITPADLSMVVFSAQGRARSREQDISLNPQLQLSLHKTPSITISHHLAHAMSAFAMSGFRAAGVLVIDGLGSPYEDFRDDEQSVAIERFTDGWESISLYQANGRNIRALEKHLVDDGRWLTRRPRGMPLFGSLGGMYSAVAMQVFGDPLEAGQVMGLAPYGESEFAPHEFFEYVDRKFVFHDTVPNRFSHNKRWPASQRSYRNLACSVQQALEKAVMLLAMRLRQLSGSDNLCYAGGVALNCVTNELLYRDSGFKNIFIAPAAEDSGPAIGAAYYGLWQLTHRNTRQRLQRDSHGREYSTAEITEAIHKAPAVSLVHSQSDVLDETVDRLCAGEFVGWFQGGSELGPRALGQRSILADPRSPKAKTLLNARIKHRASFRPFAPSILREHAHEWFEDVADADSSFMLRVWQFKPQMRELVPAVVHTDGSGRVHTVDENSHPRFHSLLQRFYQRTQVPILLNTSFNGNGEPIVETPEDALWCLLFNGLDCCVLGDVIVERQESVASVLDLYPEITTRTFLVQLPMANHHFPNQISVDADLIVRATTRWGEVEHRLPAISASILRHVDGNTAGGTILERLSHEFGAPVDEKWLVQNLEMLRRRSVITLSRHPLDPRSIKKDVLHRTRSKNKRRVAAQRVR
jgi:carbamoyltransferase